MSVCEGRGRGGNGVCCEGFRLETKPFQYNKYLKLATGQNETLFSQRD